MLYVQLASKLKHELIYIELNDAPNTNLHETVEIIFERGIANNQCILGKCAIK
jgi:hypothetical protein